MRVPSSASLMLALAGLGGICACAVAAVVGFSFDPLETVPAVKLARDPGATAGATANAPVGNPLWAVPLNALSATGDRPIFFPSRRPRAPPVIAAPPPTPRPPPPPVAQEADRPALVLVGTAVGGSRRLGVFLEEATKKLVRLEPGNGHDGWSLRRVERREAQFEKAPRIAVLALRPPLPDRRRLQRRRQRPWVRRQRNQFLPFTTENGDRQTSVCSETIDAA